MVNTEYKKMTRIKGILFFFFIITYLTLYAQSITKGPYLAEPKNTSVIIRWESDLELSFVVKYGFQTNLNNTKIAQQVGIANNRYLYEAKITHLVPSEKYYYQVISDTIKSDISYFQCNVPEDQPFTFVVTGDSRSNVKIFSEISERVNQDNPDLIISVGDLVRNGGEFAQWEKYFFNIAKNVINHIPFIPSVGDHEASKGDGDEGKLFTHFFFPHKDYKKLWYSYNYGDAHFVVLDYRYPNSNEMIEWFKKDMSNSKSKWNFVYMHRPSYNLGGHCSAWGREIWPKLFTEYNIDIVFAGHSHLYERFYPVKPIDKKNAHAVTYITSGGSGAYLYKSGDNPVLAFTKSVYHYIVVKINGEKIDLNVYQKDGTILDEISWKKNSDDFNAIVKSQEELDIVGMFMNNVSQQIKRLPMKEIPALMTLKLKQVYCKDSIEFKISLSEESQKYYDMEEVSDTIKNAEPKTITVKIFAKGDMTVSKWGEITPELKLKVEYKSSLFSGTVISKAIEYEAY